MKNLFVVIVLFLIGCGQASEPGANIPNNVVAQDSGLPPLVSGSRIKIGYYTGSDGSRYPSGAFMDSLYNVTATVQKVGVSSTLSFVPDFPISDIWTCDGASTVSYSAGVEGGYVVDHTHRLLRLGPATTCQFMFTFTDVTDTLVTVTEMFE